MYGVNIKGNPPHSVSHLPPYSDSQHQSELRVYKLEIVSFVSVNYRLWLTPIIRQKTEHFISHSLNNSSRKADEENYSYLVDLKEKDHSQVYCESSCMDINFCIGLQNCVCSLLPWLFIPDLTFEVPCSSQ